MIVQIGESNVTQITSCNFSPIADHTVFFHSPSRIWYICGASILASVSIFNEAKDIEAHLTQKMHLHFLTNAIFGQILRQS